jgi:WD40 repeat protein/serine/threonine protein kinase
MDDSRPLPESGAEARADAADCLRQRWLQGQRPEPAEFLARFGALPPAEVAAVLRVDQGHRWLCGERIAAETYLRLFPAVAACPESAVDLIYGEYLLRERDGTPPNLNAFLARFPKHAVALRIQIELHEAIARCPTPEEVCPGLGDAGEEKANWPSGPTSGGEEGRGEPAGAPALPVTRAVSPDSPRKAGARPAGLEDPAAPANGSGLPVLDGYDVLAELGRGGMGVIYKARQVGLNRLVALKMISTGNLAGPAELTRFRTEAEAVARLRHPNVVQIYEVGRHQGLSYLALEFMDRGSLAPHLTARLLSPRQAAELIETLARAVQAAHDQGIIHRDLKPANVLLATPPSPGTPAGVVALLGVAKITDFGLAKRLDGAPGSLATEGHTLSGTILGTPGYMAPEQAEGKTRHVGPAADTYSLGAILYEALTGRPPFAGGTLLETLEMVRSQEPVSPSRLQANLPRDLVTICLKALAKEPCRRYASAAALANDLRRFQGDLPVHARPVKSWERAWRWCRRNPALASLIATVALLLATVAVVVTIGYVRTTMALDQEADQRQVAEHQRELARQAQDRAQERARAARDEAVRNRRLLYDADMQLAAQLWESETGTAQAVTDLLKGHIPRPGEDDLRDFAWHYQWSLLHGALTLRGDLPATYIYFAPDGNLLTVDRPRRLGYWDRGRPRPRQIVPLARRAPIKCWVFSPDRATLALGRTDGTVVLYDHKTRRQRQIVKAASGLIDLEISADGRTLVGVHADGQARFWEATTGKPRATIALRNTRRRCSALSPDGQTLVLADHPANGQVSVYRVGETGPHVLPGPSSTTYCVAYSPDGQTIASSDSGQLILWNAASLQPTGRIATPGGYQNTLAFSRDGRWLAGGASDGLVTVWDVAKRQRRFWLKGHISCIWSLDFSADAKMLVAGAADGTAKIWDLSVPRGGCILGSPGDNYLGLAYSPDGKWLATCGVPGKLWDARTQQLVRRLGLAKRVAFSPDSKILATGGLDGLVGLWDVAGGRLRRSLQGRPTNPARNERMVSSLAFSPDGRFLAAGFGWPTVVVGDYSQIVQVWDAHSGREVATLPHQNAVPSLAFSPDGRLLAAACHDNTVRLWSVGRWQESRRLEGPEEFRAVAFSPGGRRLAAGSSDGTVRLWDPATGRLLRLLQAHALTTIHVAFSPDGKTLASASFDHTIKLWDVARGRELRTLMGHTQWVTCVAFSPDGTQLASTGNGNTVRLWDGLEPEVRARKAQAAVLKDLLMFR